MTELKTKTLAQIVSGDHRAATIFEKYNLDFCCKGKRSLEQACAEKELSLDQVAAELDNVFQEDQSSSKDFDKMTLTELSEYIVRNHHAYIKKESPEILGYLQKVASKHAAQHPELVRILELFAAIKEEMDLHMQKEEVILFARIKTLESLIVQLEENRLSQGWLQSPISMMEQEHEHAGRLMDEIRTLTNNYDPPATACTTYRLVYALLQAFEIDLHRHVHLENNILFPKALKLFGSSAAYSLN